MRTPKPVGPGWYKFEGLRTTPSGKYIVRLDDVVKVIGGNKPGTYRVLCAGSALQYSTEVYTGTWERLEVETKEAA